MIKIKEAILNGYKSIYNRQVLFQDIFVKSNGLTLLNLLMTFKYHIRFLDPFGDDFSENSERFHGEADAYLWLKCRLMLSEYLHEEDNAVGHLSGAMFSLVGRVGSVEDVVKNGLLECEMFNDTETSCFFNFINIQKDLQCGKDSKQILKRLRVRRENIFSFSL